MPTVATLVHGALANVVLGLLVTAAFLANGAAAAGAILVGASCALVGLVFLGAALVAAQVMPTSRGANSLATWVLVGTFVLAGIGNALGTPSEDLTRLQSSWLTWLSPFGWAENTRAFDVDAWAPVALLAAASVALVAAALALQSRRDLGTAFIAESTGRPDARPYLRSNLALVTRLATPPIAGWVIGGVLVGALATALGAVADRVGGENPAIADVLEKLSGGEDMRTGLIVVFFIMLGVLAACAGVQTVIRARQDEVRGTAELVWASPLDRVHWLGDYVIVALAAVVLTIVGGVAGAVLGALVVTDAGDLARDAAIAGAGQLLPAAVFVGLTSLVFVWAPRLTIALGWMLVMLAAAIGLFGPLFGMEPGSTRISPFAAAVTPTAGGVDLGGLWWVLPSSVALVAGALALMRRRELAGG